VWQSRLQSRAKPHPILYFLRNSAPKKFRSVYHFRGQKIFGGEEKPSEINKTPNLQILSDHVRCAPAAGYNCPHPHFYFMLFCAPGSHFTHPHLFHLSFSHPRSRRKVPNSAVWVTVTVSVYQSYQYHIPDWKVLFRAGNVFFFGKNAQKCWIFSQKIYSWPSIFSIERIERSEIC
jgi:hypothetical protein